MARYIHKTAILAKIETVYGTDATPTGGANAILVSNMTINPFNATLLPRDVVRAYFGGAEQIPGAAYKEVSFECELQSSGSMVTPTIPAWGALVRACGFSETGSAGVRVEYNPITDSMEGATIYYHDDGVLHKLLGCRGDVSIALNVNTIPKLKFRFLGIDGGDTAVANPSLTLTGWKTPAAVTDPNTGDITLGCTYTAATPTLTGGTQYPSTGLEISLNNAVTHTPLLGGESVDITQRDVAGKVQFDLTAAQEVTFMTAVKAASTQSLGIIHGTTAGSKVLFFAPAMQLINPTKEDLNGRRLIGYDLRFVPSSGDDDIKLVAA